MIAYNPLFKNVFVAGMYLVCQEASERIFSPDEVGAFFVKRTASLLPER